MLANAAQASARIDFGRSDKVFNVLPVFHSFGLTVGLILPLVSGVRLYLYPSPLHYRTVPELARLRAAPVVARRAAPTRAGAVGRAHGVRNCERTRAVIGEKALVVGDRVGAGGEREKPRRGAAGAARSLDAHVGRVGAARRIEAGSALEERRHVAILLRAESNRR
jgi:hypothetical protein